MTGLIVTDYVFARVPIDFVDAVQFGAPFGCRPTLSIRETELSLVLAPKNVVVGNAPPHHELLILLFKRSFPGLVDCVGEVKTLCFVGSNDATTERFAYRYGKWWSVLNRGNSVWTKLKINSWGSTTVPEHQVKDLLVIGNRYKIQAISSYVSSLLYVKVFSISLKSVPGSVSRTLGGISAGSSGAGLIDANASTKNSENNQSDLGSQDAFLYRSMLLSVFPFLFLFSALLAFSALRLPFQQGYTCFVTKWGMFLIWVLVGQWSVFFFLREMFDLAPGKRHS